MLIQTAGSWLSTYRTFIAAKAFAKSRRVAYVHGYRLSGQAQHSRRKFLKGAGTVTEAPLLIGATPRLTPSLFRACGSSRASGPFPLNTCGSWHRGQAAMVFRRKAGGISSALVVGEKFYLIDLSDGSTHRMSEVFNRGTFIKTLVGTVERGHSRLPGNLNGAVFTHPH
jgi:hypothetical protein